MKIGDFQQIAQTENDSKRVVQDKESGNLKTSSFKGKALSHLKGEAKERNANVKEAFIKSIKDTYGNDAAETARGLLGGKGKSLTVRDVRRVLYGERQGQSKSGGRDAFQGVVTFHRTQGKSNMIAEQHANRAIQAAFTNLGIPESDISSDDVKKLTLAGVQRELKGLELGSVEAQALATVDKDTIRQAVKERFPRFQQNNVDLVTTWIRGASHDIEVRLDSEDVETDTPDIPRATFAIQTADVNKLLHDAGILKLDDSSPTIDAAKCLDLAETVEKLKPGPMLDRLVLATDSELKALVLESFASKLQDPASRNTELNRLAADTNAQAQIDGFVQAIRDGSPTMSLTRASSGEAVPGDISIAGKTYTKPEVLGEGGFGKVYKYTAPDGDTVVVKRMNASGADEAAGKEIHAHRYAMEESGGSSHLAELVSPMRDSEGSVCIVLKEAEHGDLSRVFGTDSEIDDAVGRLISEKTAGDIKKVLARDLLLGMTVLRNDLQMIHRDMKPGNAFISGDGHLKIADFGESAQALTARGGTQTEAYVNYDVYTEDIAKRGADDDGIAVGVMLWEMAKGDIPFNPGKNGSINDLKNARRDHYATHDGLAQGNMATGDPELDKLINGLTNKNPEMRITVEDALDSPWFDSIANEDEVELIREQLTTVLDLTKAERETEKAKAALDAARSKRSSEPADRKGKQKIEED